MGFKQSRESINISFPDYLHEKQSARMGLRWCERRSSYGQMVFTCFIEEHQWPKKQQHVVVAMMNKTRFYKYVIIWIQTSFFLRSKPVIILIRGSLAHNLVWFLDKKFDLPTITVEYLDLLVSFNIIYHLLWINLSHKQTLSTHTLVFIKV